MISIVPITPSAAALIAPVEIPTLHAEAACVTPNTAVPMEIDADRACAVGLAMADQATCVFPVPEVAEETLSQSALDVACQVQAVTKLKVPVVPVDSAVAEDGVN